MTVTMFCGRGAALPRVGFKEPGSFGSKVLSSRVRHLVYLVAEWIHFTLFGIILPTIKLKVYTFWGL